MIEDNLMLTGASMIEDNRLLLFAAVVAMLLTAQMAHIYVKTYSKIMQTEISVSFENVGFTGDKFLVSIVISIRAGGAQISPDKLQYYLYLNGKYLLQDLIEDIPPLEPWEEVSINRTLIIPEERMFTIKEAMNIEKWNWRVSGSLFTQTIYGETLIRFWSSKTLAP